MSAPGESKAGAVPSDQRLHPALLRLCLSFGDHRDWCRCARVSKYWRKNNVSEATWERAFLAEWDDHVAAASEGKRTAGSLFKHRMRQRFAAEARMARGAPLQTLSSQAISDSVISRVTFSSALQQFCCSSIRRSQPELTVLTVLDAASGKVLLEKSLGLGIPPHATVWARARTDGSRYFTVRCAAPPRAGAGAAASTTTAASAAAAAAAAVQAGTSLEQAIAVLDANGRELHVLPYTSAALHHDADAASDLVAAGPCLWRLSTGKPVREPLRADDEYANVDCRAGVIFTRVKGGFTVIVRDLLSGAALRTIVEPDEYSQPEISRGCWFLLADERGRAQHGEVRSGVVARQWPMSATGHFPTLLAITDRWLAFVKRTAPKELRLLHAKSDLVRVLPLKGIDEVVHVWMDRDSVVLLAAVDDKARARDTVSIVRIRFGEPEDDKAAAKEEQKAAAVKSS